MTDTAAPTLRRLRLADATEAERRALTDRASTATPEVRARAREIVDAVREGGDAALREANARFGGGLKEPIEAPALRVPAADLRAARREGAPQVARRARDLIRPLALPDLRLAFTVEPDADDQGLLELEGRRCRITPRGADRVGLAAQPNPGEAPAEVAKRAQHARVTLRERLEIAKQEAISRREFE